MAGIAGGRAAPPQSALGARGEDLFRDVSPLLRPRSIAIVGASERPGSWTARVYNNLRRFGFPGPVYPVNPRYGEIYGTRCYPSVSALPEPPDQVVVFVRAASVLGVLEEAGPLGCRSALVLSAGFGEMGTAEGRATEAALEEVADRYGIRIGGPNCLGNLALPARTVTYCEQVTEQYRAGGFGFVSHSSAIMGASFRYAAQRGVGISYGIGIGNETNTDAADYLAFLADDEDTRVIGLFVEGIRRPDAFVAALERAARADKPILIVRAGRSRAAREAALTHTGTLASERRVFDAVVERYGLITVSSTDEAVEVAELVTRSRFEHPDGLAVVTLSGGVRGVLLDLAEELGVPLAPLTPATLERLQDMMDVGSAAGNPLDIGWSGLASADVYQGCVRTLLEDPSVHAVAIQEELPKGEQAAARAQGYLVMEALGREHDKPVVFFSRGTHNVSEYGLAFHERARAPFLQELRRSFGALSGVLAYRRRRESTLRDRSPALAPPPSVEEWARKLEGASGPLPDEAAYRLLAAAGLPVAPWRLARTAPEAATAARELGLPVALKLSVPGLTHKTELGAIRLGLGESEQVAAAARDLLLIAEERGLGQERALLVQRMAPPGVEMLLSCVRDPQFGPVVYVGLGGIFVEAFDDLQAGLAPIDADDARAMIERLRGRRLLRGVRGAPPADEDALVEAMLGLSRLGVALGNRLGSIEINPLVVGPRGQGGMAVDAVVLPGQTGRSSTGRPEKTLVPEVVR